MGKHVFVLAGALGTTLGTSVTAMAGHHHRHHHHHHHTQSSSAPASTTTPAPSVQHASHTQPETNDARHTRTAMAAAPTTVTSPRTLPGHEAPPQRLRAEQPRAVEPSPTVASAVTTTVASPAPAPGPAHVAGCSVAASPWRMEVSPGSTRPVQVTLASRGDEALALVTLSYLTRDPREGLRFAESRIIHIKSDGPRSMMIAPAFEPDASLAWGSDGTVFVAGYSSFDPRGDATTVQRTLEASTFLLPALHEGRVERVSHHRFENTLGWTVESRPIPTRDGFAAMLATSLEGAGTRLQWTVFNREAEMRTAASVDVARESSVASLEFGSRYRAGTSLQDDHDQLAAAWMAPEQGVWLRARKDDTWQTPVHRPIRDVWGVEVVSDGSGVLLRTGGASGQAAALEWLGWNDTQSVRLGTGWDVLAVQTRGYIVAAGLSHDATSGGEIGFAPVGQPLTLAHVSEGTRTSLANAIDLDLVPTRSGALLAWIEPAEGPERPVRHLSMLRIVCTAPTQATP